MRRGKRYKCIVYCRVIFSRALQRAFRVSVICFIISNDLHGFHHLTTLAFFFLQKWIFCVLQVHPFQLELLALRLALLLRRARDVRVVYFQQHLFYLPLRCTNRPYFLLSAKSLLYFIALPYRERRIVMLCAPSRRAHAKFSALQTLYCVVVPFQPSKNFILYKCLKNLKQS